MADWLRDLSDKFGSGFKKKKIPLLELLPQMLDPGDPRIAIRPMGGDWLCPYTGKRLMVPDWDGSSLTLLRQTVVFEHLLGLPYLQEKGLEAQMKSWDALVDLVAAFRMKENPSYKICSDKGYWICPHCLTITGVLLEQWDGSLAPLEWFIPAALEHLHQCQDYNQDPLNPKSPAEVAQSQGERGIRMELLKRVALDPLFRVSDDLGEWICPFSQRPIPTINVLNTPWGVAQQNAIVEYLLSPACPGRYSQWKPEVSLADLQRIAGRISAERSHARGKQAAEDELVTLRRRVVELDQRAASADEIEKDLEAARKVQLKMLPAKAPDIPGYEIAAFYQPCVHLGGDLYNFLEVGQGRTGFVIGDVSGHGVSAAVIMAMAQKAFSVRCPNRKPAEVLNDVNRDLVRDIQRGKFVTAYYLVLEHVTGALHCARAGHPPALLVQPDGSLRALEGGGLALGLGSPEVFQQKLEEYEVYLAPGAALLLYTDGLSEAMNEDKEEFGFKRLRAALSGCGDLAPQNIILSVLSAVREFAGNMPMEDDLALVALRRLPEQGH